MTDVGWEHIRAEVASLRARAALAVAKLEGLLVVRELDPDVSGALIELVRLMREAD